MASADELLAAGSSSRINPADAAAVGVEGTTGASGGTAPPEAAGRARKKGSGRRQQPHLLHQQDWQDQEPLPPLQLARQEWQQQSQRGHQRQQLLQYEQPFSQQQAYQAGQRPHKGDQRQQHKLPHQHQQQQQQQQWTAMPPRPVGPTPATSFGRPGSSQLEETWDPAAPGLQASNPSGSDSWPAAPPAPPAAGAGGLAPGGTVEDDDFNSMLLSEC
jgi:hypothetical protein